MQHLAMTPAFILFALTLLLPCAPMIHAQVLEEHRYRQQTGDQVKYFTWTLTGNEELSLTSVSAEETHLTVLDRDLRTLRWERHNPSEGTRITAKRKAGAIILSGSLRNEIVERRIEVGETPWYQALSLSLRNLVDSDRDSEIFWTLRPDNLKAHKVEAKLLGKESLRLEDRDIRALRIELRLTGMARLFWSCDYWFRSHDALLLRYEGPSGPPGAPRTEVRLIE